MPLLDQSQTPYADALAEYAQRDVLRLNVPGHNARRDVAERLSDYFGHHILEMDLTPLLPGIDHGADSPLAQARILAADAWDAHRTWFLTNGASQANRISAMALSQLGTPDRPIIAQRSAHSSFIDGLILSGMNPVWVTPTIDHHHGINHGVTVDSFRAALAANPTARGAYVISPSYFGAVADIAGLADVAHAAGIPLIVDGAWGTHFGFGTDVPESPLRLGADVLVSSTHKLGGSLTQSAMLHVGKGPFADELTAIINRTFTITQSTSNSSLLLASLDIARSGLALGAEAISRSVQSADNLRDRTRSHPKLSVLSDGYTAFPDIVAHDPLHVAIDVSGLGRSGLEVRNLLMTDFHIELEIATDNCVVGIVGPGHEVDGDRLLSALDSLATDSPTLFAREARDIPAVSRRAMPMREAFFAAAEEVSDVDAIGRISADTIAAYPPGIPNLVPGEIITEEIVSFLKHTAEQPGGWVRGALTETISRFRVVAK
ncbi:MAG: Arginine decarboxylase [Actinomycetota bacterium]|jgi:arginine/lysine/ornithine decarboxylase